MPTAEHRRLREITDDIHSWRRWGPYLGDRAWGTVREDYSADGEAWDYFPHDLARSKAYRWGEDGIAGICDRYQLLCFAPAFWNGRDPILKERLFGLAHAEGNHGEDVKEYYFHLDNTPTHSYMKFLYKYPQREFPYRLLMEANQERHGQGPEFELLDTGIFSEDRYFDIVIEYAKATPEDWCIRIEAFNRGPEAAPLHILPHLWFRNTWAWAGGGCLEPRILAGRAGPESVTLVAEDSACDTLSNIPVHYGLGERTLHGPAGGRLLFTFNETNMERVYGPGNRSRKRYVKDAFHRWLIGKEDCINPQRVGTKAALHYFYEVPAGGSVVLRLRLREGEAPAEPSGAAKAGSAGASPSHASPSHASPYHASPSRISPLAEVDAIIAQRKSEADEFYQAMHQPDATEDERRVQRQALAGLLWTKQCYLFDVQLWLNGDNPAWPPPKERLHIRNTHWRHLNSMRVMTVPDKWEYPWFAAWDLAFQCVALAQVDPAYAKEQLWLLLFEQFQHPNGQIPAYEWEFSDLNPPVHAWAVWRVYGMGLHRSGQGDRRFLERCFHKLLINFAWWINKVDREGNNIFEGGFLGLDNITVVDRSKGCADGSVLEQADATGWMGMFCLNMLRIAMELAKENSAYESLATKFFQHYVYVAAAMKRMGNRGYQLWDDHDGFFYDVLRFPNGSFQKFRVRSLVGLIPLFAVERLEVNWIKPFKEFSANVEWFLKNRRDLAEGVVQTVEHDGETTHVLTIVNQEQLVRSLARVWDPDEFLSDFGVRSLSKYHEKHPFEYGGRVVGYEPAEATSKLKGGNSNWRGPIWMPTNFLLIESLRKLGKAYGQSFAVALPGGQALTFDQMARDLAHRLLRLFTANAAGKRPVHGDIQRFQHDPHWRDLLLFYEYFHGDNGAGLGASHQTGWTALVASLLDEWRG
jgi:hypothetical protein